MCPITSCPQRLKDTKGDEGEEEDPQHQQNDTSLVMSLQDVVDPPPFSPPHTSEQPPEDVSGPIIDDISIPMTAQIFDFCESDIFPDTLQTSEVTSSPNCYSYEDQNTSYANTNISFPSCILVENHHTETSKFNNTTINNNLDIVNYQQADQNDQQTGNTSTTSSSTTTATTINPPGGHHSSGLSVIYDPQVEIDNDISASIDFSPSPPFSAPPLPYNLNPTLSDPLAISNGLTVQYPTPVDPTVAIPLLGPPPLSLGPVFEDDCLSSIPSFLRLNPSIAAAAAAAAVSSSSSCTFLEPPPIGSYPPGNLSHGLCSDNSGFFGGGLMMASELQAKELDFQGDNAGIFCTDQLPRYSSGDMQAFSNENSQMVSGGTSSAPISSEISSLEDSIKVGKLSVEERKEKIHRYMKKRNERNFSKKIKYACRKTLADSRPRVRGRFAKNDEFGENHKHMNGHHDEDDYDEVAVKEEDDLVDSSDIFAHISGVNSFKCNYQIQSWI